MTTIRQPDHVTGAAIRLPGYFRPVTILMPAPYPMSQFPLCRKWSISGSRYGSGSPSPCFAFSVWSLTSDSILAIPFPCFLFGPLDAGHHLLIPYTFQSSEQQCRKNLSYPVFERNSPQLPGQAQCSVEIAPIQEPAGLQLDERRVTSNSPSGLRELKHEIDGKRQTVYSLTRLLEVPPAAPALRGEIDVRRLHQPTVTRQIAER